MSDFPPFLQDLLGRPPSAGEGVHSWLYRVARHLHAHMTPEQIANALRSAVAGCGRRVTEREILAAVRNSAKTAWKPSKLHAAPARNGSAPLPAQPPVPPAPPVRAWPDFDDAAAFFAELAAFADGVTGEADLRGRSPTCDPGRHEAAFHLDRLFPGDPLLCLGRSVQEAATRLKSEWLSDSLDGLVFIVPSPMTARTGLTQEGNPSPRCLGNVGPRRFLVVEFDRPDLSRDRQARILWGLSKVAPLALVLFSGGKSLHSWFSVQGLPEGTVKKFHVVAVRRGADPATFTRCQFVRLPGATRPENGKRQEVLYFDPDAIGLDTQAASPTEAVSGDSIPPRVVDDDEQIFRELESFDDEQLPAMRPGRTRETP